MKRPQGFDRPGPASEPAPTKSAATKSVRHKPATTQSATTKPAASEPPLPRVVPGPATADDPAPVGTGSSAARLRQAARARRRYERDEVRRFTQRSRKRRTAWLIGVGIVAALVVLVVVGSLSPLLAVRTIQVEGTGRVDSSAVVHALENQVGRPLALIDAGAVKRDLAAFPLIRSYTTESHPPGTLVVRIVERQPIGVVRMGGEFALVDSARVVISSSRKPPTGYPVIQSNSAAAAPGKAGFDAAVSVLAALPHELHGRVVSATASTKDNVTLTLTGGQEIAWGSAENSSLKADVLAKLIAATAGKSVTRYDVSSPTSAVVS